MEDPASCPHNQAYWFPAPFGSWKYRCVVCGLEAIGLDPEPAKTLFGVKAEKAKVASLVARREAGEKLTTREEAIVAYSPFGTASRCGY